MLFSYYLPVNLIFGRGEIAKLGEQAAAWGKRALVVTGKSSRQTGLLDRALDFFEKSGVSAVVFDEVSPNPLTTAAEKGADFALREKCDVVVGIGGGSILDAAKGIAFLSGNKGDLNEFIFGAPPTGKALPLILVPTTCGTGSEGNSFAVFTNPVTKDKKSLRDIQAVAKVSIIDPELMMTMPKKTLACVGFDAFCHCLEAYLSRRAQPLSDYMSYEGMKIIAECLPKLYRGIGDVSDWEKVSWASTLGGMAINTAGVTAAHAMEHPVSGLSDAVHGQGLAALTQIILEATDDTPDGRLGKISAILGGESAGELAGLIWRFVDDLELRFKLSDFGITENDLGWLTENCLKVSAAGIAAHPTIFSEKQIYQLYKNAL